MEISKTIKFSSMEYREDDENIRYYRFNNVKLLQDFPRFPKDTVFDWAEYDPDDSVMDFYFKNASPYYGMVCLLKNTEIICKWARNVFDSEEDTFESP